MGWGVLHACTCSRRRTHKIRQTHTDAHEGQYALEREHFMPLLDLLIAGAELEAERFVVVDALLEASPPQILELATTKRGAGMAGRRCGSRSPANRDWEQV